MLWLVARLWLGYGRPNAGCQKLWDSEKAAFWNGGGAGGSASTAAGGCSGVAQVTDDLAE